MVTDDGGAGTGVGAAGGSLDEILRRELPIVRGKYVGGGPCARKGMRNALSPARAH